MYLFNHSYKNIDSKTFLFIVRTGSRPNVRDGRGRSPLQLVAESSDVWGNRFGEAVDTLLTFGARMQDKESPQCGVIKESPQVSLEVCETL